MKKVTYFQATDGSLHKTEKACQAHDTLREDIERVRRTVLPKKFDTCAFSNGEGYIQLTEETHGRFSQAVFALIKKKHPGAAKEYTIDNQWLGRVLSDNESPLYRLWCLVWAIDGQHRLWGQRYYRDHPEEGAPKCLAKR